MNGPQVQDIEKVQVEPTGDPGQMGYVTNDPEDTGTIHIPEHNIKRQLQKAQPGIDPNTLKDQQEALIEDVVIPHEQAHIQDVNKGEGKFSPSTEQRAEKEEDWSRMEEQFGLTPKGRFAADQMLINKARNMPELAAYPWAANLINKQVTEIKPGEWADLKDLVQKIQKGYDGGGAMINGSLIASMLDEVANSLEKRGLIKEATEIDAVSNTLGDARTEVMYKPELDGKINDNKYSTFRAYITAKNSNYIDINAHSLIQAEGIVKSLGFVDQVIAIKLVKV